MAAPEFVIMTTASDDKVGIMASLGFQCIFYET